MTLAFTSFLPTCPRRIGVPPRPVEKNADSHSLAGGWGRAGVVLLDVPTYIFQHLGSCNSYTGK